MSVWNILIGLKGEGDGREQMERYPAVSSVTCACVRVDEAVGFPPSAFPWKRSNDLTERCVVT